MDHRRWMLLFLIAALGRAGCGRPTPIAFARAAAAILPLLLLASCVRDLEITTGHLLMACDSCRQQGVPVDVLWKAPDRPFVAIAHVEAGSNIPEEASWEAIKLALCRETHELDADAVVVGDWQFKDDSWTVGFIGYGGQAKLLRGLAIRYGDPD